MRLLYTVPLGRIALAVWVAAVFMVPTAAAQGQDEENIAFPIVTHYPERGGTDPAPQTGAVEVAYGVYHNRETDYYAPSRAKVEQFVRAVRVAMLGTPLHLLNALDDAEEGSSAVQIVNNVPVEGALYTLMLPPGWSRSGCHPVVLSGNGAGTSNNRRLYGDMEIYGPLIAWGSAREGRCGIILAVSNCGGTESQGIDDKTLRSVGAFFDFIAQHGGDKHNAVTTGGSRGGGTALVWAANPLALDYTVNAVFAHVPPTHYGSLSTTSILTYPSLGGIAELVLGEGGARFDAGPDSMEAKIPEALTILAGTGAVDALDARSPIGLAERLRGKQIAIAAGTHDSYFQLALFLAFDRRLTDLGIDHATAVILGEGHSMSTWLYQETINYLDALARGEAYTVPPGRRYFIRTPEGHAPLEDFLGRPVDGLPFTVELPARSGAGLPIDVSACGTPGKMWRITLTGPAGSTAWEESGTFDASECATYRLETPEEVGIYTWAFAYDGEVIPNSYTPFRDSLGCGAPAVTVVMPAVPVLANRFYVPGFRSFGIDQFIAQAEGCPARIERE